MITNAKQYNDKRSAVYEDAERVRKTASNWFTKHNPAYRDPSYVAVATPIPGDGNVATLGNASRRSEVSVGSPIKAPEPTQQAEPDEDAESAENDEEDR